MSDQSDDLAIGVDVGATKIAAALVTRDGEILESLQVPTRAEEGSPVVLDRIAAQINALLRRVAANSLVPVGVGIGTPGQVNALRGTVRNAVNLGWEEISLVDEVCSRLTQELPVLIQKDANASALGEYYFGSARGCEDFVYLGIGSGLGGGIVTNGVLVTGADWNAAELGHLSLDPHGLQCNCGSRGCAETIVSGLGLINLVERYLAQDDVPTQLFVDKPLTTRAILSAAQAGDRLALDALMELGRHFGMVMAACVSTLNPGRIIVGGGLGLAAYDFLLPAAQAELHRRVLPASYSNLRILPSTLVSSAVGAAALVWYFTDKHNLFQQKEVV